MATLQVKNLPEDVHAALRRRAEAEGISLTELVSRALRREAALPSMDEWLARLRTPGTRDLDTTAVLDEVRAEPLPGEGG